MPHIPKELVCLLLLLPLLDRLWKQWKDRNGRQ